MVWYFVWDLNFSVMSFLKKCAAAVAKKSETLERKEGKREGELTEIDMQSLF